MPNKQPHSKHGIQSKLHCNNDIQATAWSTILCMKTQVLKPCSKISTKIRNRLLCHSAAKQGYRKSCLKAQRMKNAKRKRNLCLAYLRWWCSSPPSQSPDFQIDGCPILVSCSECEKNAFCSQSCWLFPHLRSQFWLFAQCEKTGHALHPSFVASVQEERK